MKQLFIVPKRKAFTLFEVLVVASTIALLAFILLPVFTVRSHAGRGHVACINNLKQIGLAMRMFGDDHENKLPWEVAASQGGSLDYRTGSEVFRHFLSASNELGSARVLVCPYDLGRMKALDWNTLANSNLSYFVGLNAVAGRASTILAGDRTLSLDGTNPVGCVAIQPQTDLRISGSFHDRRLNLAFADGSAQQMTEKQVRRLIFQTNDLPFSVAVP
jgi:prepilin-type processing-associated H-X9-DG protein